MYKCKLNFSKCISRVCSKEWYFYVFAVVNIVFSISARKISASDTAGIYFCVTNNHGWEKTIILANFTYFYFTLLKICDSSIIQFLCHCLQLFLYHLCKKFHYEHFWHFLSFRSVGV